MGCYERNDQLYSSLPFMSDVQGINFDLRSRYTKRIHTHHAGGNGASKPKYETNQLKIVLQDTQFDVVNFMVSGLITNMILLTSLAGPRHATNRPLSPL